jgi:hypothetical protein
MFEGAVVGTLGGRVEAAAGELPLLQMVLEALAAEPFAVARFVGAIAVREIFFLIAFHEYPSIFSGFSPAPGILRGFRAKRSVRKTGRPH